MMKKRLLLYLFKINYAFAAKYPKLWKFCPTASYLGG